MIDSLFLIRQSNVRCYYVRIGFLVTVYWAGDFSVNDDFRWD
jgi:hypothetical protein